MRGDINLWQDVLIARASGAHAHNEDAMGVTGRGRVQVQRLSSSRRIEIRMPCDMQVASEEADPVTAAAYPNTVVSARELLI